VVKVNEKQSEEFVGDVRVDGELHRVKGNLLAEFGYQALEVDFAFALLNAKESEKIGVEDLGDLGPVRAGCASAPASGSGTCDLVKIPAA